ncbi:MAG: hypothetical protein JXR51_16355 [Bacteroidales bacterium]|nr:hypothetical protein [Bacteroidales bacterium]MBN2758739.1 hypothetical protein [Bacteroidales bacterium]
MKTLNKIAVTFIYILININLNAQIDVIKDLADSSKDVISDISPDVIDAGCSAFSCCWDVGFQMFTAFIIEHHKEILDLRNVDPSVLSLELKFNFALGLHHSLDKNYIYVNYLPGIRANAGVFASDFRFNILTENTDDMPNSFTSWEWLFLLNIEPVETFRITFGTGIQKEEFTDKFYNQHYLGFKIGTFEGRDYIEADTRLSMDYASNKLPFFEGAISYNTRIINFNFADVYIRIGGIYQNYYSAHDIWAANGGLIFNLH